MSTSNWKRKGMGIAIVGLLWSVLLVGGVAHASTENLAALIEDPVSSVPISTEFDLDALPLAVTTDVFALECDAADSTVAFYLWADPIFWFGFNGSATPQSETVAFYLWADPIFWFGLGEDSN